MSALPDVIRLAPPGIDAAQSGVERESEGAREKYSLTDPPADIEQNSNNPSKAGQSSPIRTIDSFGPLAVILRDLDCKAYTEFHDHSSLLPSLD